MVKNLFINDKIELLSFDDDKDDKKSLVKVREMDVNKKVIYNLIFNNIYYVIIKNFNL